MDFTIFLTSSVVGGLVAGFVALRNSERKIQIENVTQERAKWREKIRAKSNEVHRSAVVSDAPKLFELLLEFSLNLNPFDPEDGAILTVIKELNVSDGREAKLAEFAERIALLLKHDWERAKHEAKPWFFRCCKPERTTYGEFKSRCTRTLEKR
ncbi:MAG: hypothetical protein Q8O37_13145 [Sulfuricellaceae bacterium]|nr:hypothetical protein [Sulfuricellaceae bacterium]